jgi:hypothetical protein
LAEADGWKVQYSIKFGNGGLLNIRADTVEDVLSEAVKLEDLGQPLVAIAEKMQAAATVQMQFQDATLVRPEEPKTPVRKCAHNVAMEYREGVSKAGKAYKAYFCRVKNDPALPECAAQFLN